MNFPCVYQIKNTINKKCYIGATKDFNQRRLTHIYSLRSGVNQNHELQQDYNLYGEEFFRFDVLCFSDEKMILEFESRLIKQRNKNGSPLYNQREMNGHCCYLKESVNGMVRKLIKAGFNKWRIKSYYYGERNARYLDAIQLAKIFGTDAVIWMDARGSELAKNVQARKDAMPAEVVKWFRS